jgi:subtilisin family serine protease
MKYRFVGLLLCWLVVAQMTLAQNHTSPWQLKVDATVAEAVQEGKSVEVIIVMQAQTDVSAARQRSNKTDKGRFVFEQLQHQARTTQKPILDILAKEQIPHRAFFVVNAIHAQLHPALVPALAARADVAYLASNPYIRMEEPMLTSAQHLDATVTWRNDVTWGIQQIRADQVWDLGYTGQGVVVGGQDTGYEWTHPTIRNRYRGWNGTTANHHYNWYDAIRQISPLHGDSVPNPALNPCGLDTKAPCDDHNHGTHTMGTMVGDDGAGNKIGVAPNAQWIAARNMERGYGSPATYIECFEWFLAPTDLQGQNPRPDLAPHVINNSWSCPAMEGCNPSNWALMDMAINNLRAAGVVVVQSAGNSGSACSSINAAAAIFEGAFAVGASRQNDTIAGFSSRGPVVVDGSGRLKPNVVAPGVSVRSAIRGGSFATWNGTSMAGPHVAGVVALIISANPALAGQVETIERILEETAKPMRTDQACGNRSGLDVPNHTYGYGRVDALAAVQYALNLSHNAALPSPTQSVEVFPNPSGDVATFKLHGFQNEVVLRLFRLNGQLIQALRWKVQDTSLQTLDLHDLPSGIYFYQIASGDTFLSGKFVKH